MMGALAPTIQGERQDALQSGCTALTSRRVVVSDGR